MSAELTETVRSAPLFFTTTRPTSDPPTGCHPQGDSICSRMVSRRRTLRKTDPPPFPRSACESASTPTQPNVYATLKESKDYIAGDWSEATISGFRLSRVKSVKI